jgi:hypothetical protein
MSYSNVRALLSVASYPFDLLAGTINGGTFMSSDTGRTFTGFPDASEQIGGLAHVNSILKFNSQFWAGTDKGMRLLDQFYPLTSWIAFSDGLPSVETKVRVVMAKDGEIYAGTDGGVFKLNGSTWNEKNNGLTFTNVTALASTGGYLIAGTANGTGEGIYISSDNGDNWTYSKSISVVTSILTVDSNIFVGSFGDGIWLSKTYGATWSQVNDGFSAGAYYVQSLGANSQYIFAGTNNANIWRRPLSQVITVPLPVELTSFNGVAKGKAVELKWATATEVNNYGFEIERRETSSQFSKVGFVAGSGVSSSPHQYSFADRGIPAGRYVYRIKQIDKNGSFKYTQSVDVEVGSAPKAFTLSRNYPDPFNPSTTLEFTLEQNGRAVMKIYNVLGQEVATVFDQQAEAGRIYQAQFNASRFTSGVYMSVLESGGKRLLRKMLLVK